jgi:ribosomal 30S subunit maturation factor RimM
VSPSSVNSIDPESFYVVLGRVGRPHGVRGMLHVDFAGSHLRDFVGESVALCRTDKIAQLVRAPTILQSMLLEQAEPANGDVNRVAFAGVTDRDAAARLTHLLIVQPLALMRQRARAQHASARMPITRLWYFEMFGLTVVDSRDNQQIGHISAIEELGKNTLVTITLNEARSPGQQEITLPLEYPHWGEADLDRNEIQLAEWQHFTEG